MPRALPSLRWSILVGAILGMCQTSCRTAESDALASEVEAVSREPERCEIGSIASVSHCGLETSCHVCARPSGDEAICVQPCTLGRDECPGGQTCRPIGELRDGGGYARIGDCPAGYCR